MTFLFVSATNLPTTHIAAHVIKMQKLYTLLWLWGVDDLPPQDFRKTKKKWLIVKWWEATTATAATQQNRTGSTRISFADQWIYCIRNVPLSVASISATFLHLGEKNHKPLYPLCVKRIFYHTTRRQAAAAKPEELTARTGRTDFPHFVCVSLLIFGRCVCLCVK